MQILFIYETLYFKFGLYHQSSIQIKRVYYQSFVQKGVGLKQCTTITRLYVGIRQF